MSDEYEAMNKKLALRIFNELYDDEDLNELHRKSVIAQPLGFKLSTMAIIEVELNAYHDRLAEENAKLREFVEMVSSAKIYTVEVSNPYGGTDDMDCLCDSLKDKAQQLLNQLKDQKMTSKVKPALPLSAKDYDTCSRSYFVIEDANGCDLSDEEFNWISEASNNHDKLVESLREVIDLSKSPREHKEARERASKLLAELENDNA